MINYRVQFVNLTNGYTTIQIYPYIQDALDAITELMHTSKDKYRITITTKPN